MKQQASSNNKIAEMRQTASHYMAVLNAPSEKNTPEQARAFLSATLKTLLDYTDYPYIASIIHDKDIEITGELKTIHAHIFIDTPTKPTKRAILGDLANKLGIDKDLISLTPTNNSFLLVQYLIHKNDKIKTQYDKDLIITNDKEETEKRLLKRYIKPMDESEIEDNIFKSKTFTDLVVNIGLENAKKYQSVYRQVKQEADQDYEGILNELQRHKNNMRHIKTMLEQHFKHLDMMLDENQKKYLQLEYLKLEIEDTFAKFI